MRAATTILLTLFTPAILAAQQVESGTTGSAGAAAQVAASATSADGAATSVDAAAQANADARIDAAIARADANGLSTAGLESRVQMGAARGVAPARVAAAIEHRLDAMLSARDALHASGAAESRALVELGADAIESGARVTHVTQIAASFDGDTRSRAMATLGSLAARGRIGADVVGSVQSAMNAGAVTGNAGVAAVSAGSAAAGGADVATGATGGVAGTAVSAGATATGIVGASIPR